MSPFGGIGVSNLLGCIKKVNLDPKLAGKKRANQLHELEEFRLHAYENTML